MAFFVVGQISFVMMISVGFLTSFSTTGLSSKLVFVTDRTADPKDDCDCGSICDRSSICMSPYSSSR